MSRVRTALMWLFMLNKRLYKKPSFLAILCMILGITAALTLVDSDENYLVRVAVYAENEQTESFVKAIAENKSMIGYTFYDSEGEAIAAVTDEGLDAAWLFSDDLETAAEQFVRMGLPIVETVQREDTVFLRLTREKLYAELYPYVSRAIYADYMQRNFDSADASVYESYYENKIVQHQIVELKFANSDASVDVGMQMVGPMRGLLAIAVFICAYSALMSFKKDRSSGMFARIPLEKLIWVEIVYIFLATANAAAVTFIAFLIGGLFTSFITEVLYMVFYILMCTAFCVFFGELCDRIGIMGAIMPVLSMAMLVLCPIFLHTRLPAIQFLLPPYYYLMAFRMDVYLMWGLIYSVVAIVLCLLFRRLKSKYPILSHNP